MKENYFVSIIISSYRDMYNRIILKFKDELFEYDTLSIMWPRIVKLYVRLHDSCFTTMKMKHILLTKI